MSQFAWSIIGAFGMWAVAGIIGELAAKRKGQHEIARFALLVSYAGAGYLIWAGFTLAREWIGPLADEDFRNKARDAAHARGSGVMVIVFQFWPYVLIALGGWCGLQTFKLWRKFIPSS